MILCSSSEKWENMKRNLNLRIKYDIALLHQVFVLLDYLTRELNLYVARTYYNYVSSYYYRTLL